MAENKNNGNATLNEDYIDAFVDDEQLTEDEAKIKEMNKKLPKWSLEPPKGFLK
ncbi:MAG: hypothetical protein IJ811_00935 [Clostridia bacterium]|nr:hypothetical protein [Clostridia bacterium]